MPYGKGSERPAEAKSTEAQWKYQKLKKLVLSEKSPP